MGTVVIVKDLAAAFVIAIQAMAYIVKPFLVELPVTLDKIVHRLGKRHDTCNFLVRFTQQLA